MRKAKLLLILLTLNLLASSQDIEYARRIIEKLSSPEFKGRGYVGNGDRISADYISEQFRKFDLEPMNGDSYFQEFKMSVNTFPGKVTVSIDNTDLRPAIDYLIDPSCPAVKGTFKIIKTDIRYLSSRLKLDSLMGKAGDSFILVDARAGNNDQPETKKKADEFINYLETGQHLNIKGLIIYSSDKLTWSSSTHQNIRPVLTITKELDIENINSIKIRVDAKYLKDYATRNVAGLIKGKSDSDSSVVILAHYDHLGKMGKETYFPGANDNASGVAMLLNLVKYFSSNRPEHDMVFIALSGEESGLLGAKAFIKNPLTDLNKIKFLVNFDLAGTGDEGIRIVNGSIFRDKFDLITRINQQYNLLPKIDIRGAACNSDHCPFYQDGVPCFFIYTQGGIQAYHDVYDRYETLPLTEFEDYTRLMILFLNAL